MHRYFSFFVQLVLAQPGNYDNTIVADYRQIENANISVSLP